jgi:hypothetical protein
MRAVIYRTFAELNMQTFKLENPIPKLEIFVDCSRMKAQKSYIWAKPRRLMHNMLGVNRLVWAVRASERKRKINQSKNSCFGGMQSLSRS